MTRAELRFASTPQRSWRGGGTEGAAPSQLHYSNPTQQIGNSKTDLHLHINAGMLRADGCCHPAAGQNVPLATNVRATMPTSCINSHRYTCDSDDRRHTALRLYLLQCNIENTFASVIVCSTIRSADLFTPYYSRRAGLNRSVSTCDQASRGTPRPLRPVWKERHHATSHDPFGERHRSPR